MIARFLIRDYLQCWRRRKTCVEQDLDVTDGGEPSPSTRRPGHQPVQEEKSSYAELEPRLPLPSSHETPLLRQSIETTADGREKRTAHPDRRAPIAGSNSDRLKPGLSPPKSQTGLYKLPWSPFLMVASRQDTFDLGGEGDSDEESWFAEDLMDPLMEPVGLQPKGVETSAPISYEDIVELRVEENRREAVATRSRARRRALVVAKVTGTSGSSGYHLSPRRQARPMIAPISGGFFESEKPRVVTFDDRESQGVDRRALQAGDTDFDGEPRHDMCSSLLDADEEDFIESLLLEA